MSNVTKSEITYSTSNINTTIPKSSLASTSSTTSRTVTNSATHACAACRYQRRKCAVNCPLAPYFPANNQQQFLNAHKLFGVNNIAKTLSRVPKHLRDDAMTALIFTANARANDPVGGCWRIIQNLESQVAVWEHELNLVLAQLHAARARFLTQYDPIEVGCVQARSLAYYGPTQVGSSNGGELTEFDDQGQHLIPFLPYCPTLYPKQESINEDGDNGDVSAIKIEKHGYDQLT